ncbi:conserved domain-containing protein [Amycolatopsis xylanica]|uniref:Conserved domain-containing protein n=1 Tax=Amycolatopsis xylanica TaxID=589385 RepID=A0A1H3H5J5_9PSEU|nr:PRC and DUF2382 domain-containing protein [Amycolatopsis xylanica]SDY09919.1 conserved domain-containing protein [Amycolatopsis xylanica]
MTRTLRPQELIDSTVVDSHGSKIGKVGTVYLADDTRRPEWVTVRTGLFGHKESFVPLNGAALDNDGLHVNVDKDQVTEAPQTEADGHLSQSDSNLLYQHYGMPMPRTAPDAQRKDKRTDTRQGEAMTRSEEHLNVGTEQIETGHVRLRKYVVAEEQQVTVPVSHEEVRVEREPITGEARGEIGEQEQEVVLHAEKPIVSKETTAVERVRLGTETVTEEQTVSGKVRKEQIEVTRDDEK